MYVGRSDNPTYIELLQVKKHVEEIMFLFYFLNFIFVGHVYSSYNVL